MNNGYPSYSEYLSVLEIMKGNMIQDDEGNIIIENDRPQMTFLKQIIEEYEASEKYKNMVKSFEYYENKTEILNAERYYIDESGTQHVDTKLSNAKLNHPIVTKVVNQKVNFLLSKTFAIQSLDDKAQEFKTIDDIMNDDIIDERQNDRGMEFSKLLMKHYFHKKFIQKLKNVGRDSNIMGVSWIHVRYDEKGDLAFDRISALNSIPFYKDNDKTNLVAFCHFYPQVIYAEDSKGNLIKKKQKKIEFYNEFGIWHYILEDGVISHDPTRNLVSTHFSVENVISKKEEPMLWNKIPFVPFRANWIEMPIIASIGNLVDEYDRITSTISNLLNDIPNSIIVVRNYSGENKSDFTKKLSMYRSIFIRDDGDAKFLQNDFSIDAFEQHLTRLKKDIYEGSATVDTQETSLGNASGVALKFRLMDLDVACDDMSNEFETGLDNLIEFILDDMINKGLGDFTDINYDIIFNTNMIINEEEAVLNAQRMKDTVPTEILYDAIPFIEDTKKALALKETERLKELHNMYQQAVVLNMATPDIDSSTGDSKNFGDPRNAESNVNRNEVEGATPKSKSAREVNKATTIKVTDPKK